MSQMHASFGLAQAGVHRKYVSRIFETNLEDLSGVLDADLRAEVVGSLKGTGLAGSGVGTLPNDILVGKKIGDQFVDSLDRFMVRLYRIADF